jgi:hypothetical protein
LTVQQQSQTVFCCNTTTARPWDNRLIDRQNILEGFAGGHPWPGNQKVQAASYGHCRPRHWQGQSTGPHNGRDRQNQESLLGQERRYDQERDDDRQVVLQKSSIGLLFVVGDSSTGLGRCVGLSSSDIGGFAAIPCRYSLLLAAVVTSGRHQCHSARVLELEEQEPYSIDACSKKALPSLLFFHQVVKQYGPAAFDQMQQCCLVLRDRGGGWQ